MEKFDDKSKAVKDIETFKTQFGMSNGNKTTMFHSNHMSYPATRNQTDKDNADHKPPWDVFQTFCNVTTSHGFPAYINAGSSIFRHIWAAIILIGFIGITIHLTYITASYLRYSYLESTQLSNLKPEFPHITICNLIGISFNHLAKEMNNPNSAYNLNYSPMKSAVTEKLATGRYTDKEKAYVLNELKNDKILFANVGEEAVKIGYSFDDLILNCSHSGNLCNREDFKLFPHPDFFNCYTYVGGHKYFDSMIAGPESGISIILYSEATNILMNLIQSSYENFNPDANSGGIRVVIHGPGTFPDMSSDGIDIFPGVSTSIALKMAEARHLGQPYSHCYDPSYDQTEKNRTYVTGLDTCRKMCKDRFIHKRCGCFMIDSISYTKHEGKRYCSVMAGSTAEQVIDDMLCYRDMRPELSRLISKMLLQSDYCTCYWLCTENMYHSAVSQSAWPRDDVLESFIQTYISVLDNNTLAKETYDFFRRMVPLHNDENRNKSHGLIAKRPGMVPSYSKIRYEDRAGKVYAMNMTVQDKQYYEELLETANDWVKQPPKIVPEIAAKWRRQSFFRLNVYFSDCVVLEKIQYPKTEWPDLFSNIGGLLGLWGGLSVMTVIEFIFLSGRLCHSFLNRAQ